MAELLEGLGRGVSQDVDHLWVLETTLDDIGAYVADLQTRVRMGTYDPKMHGTLEEVLDEIARLLR